MHSPQVFAGQRENAKTMLQRESELVALAHIELGLKYLYGNGVERNHVRALMWFTLAAAEDQPSAGKYCDFMAASMTPLQISHAQALAEICRNSDYTECD
jgi:TPR repeat protein